ncbi:MAG: site-specific integrase [Bacteroidota bacterium]
MATVTYFTRSVSKDSKRKQSIRVRLRDGRDINLYAKSGIEMLPDHWDQSKESVKIRADFPGMDKTKKDLRDLKAFIEDEYLQIRHTGKVETDWLAITVEKYWNPDKYKKKKTTLFSFIEEFIEKAPSRPNTKTGRPVSYKMIREYSRTFEYLKAFSKHLGRDIDFNDIDLEFYEEFVSFLQDQNATVRNKDKKVKLATNTIGKKIQTLKIFLNAATEKGINTSTKFKSRRFQTLTEESDNIYLNTRELEQLYNLDLSESPTLDRVRDLFLVGCWTGCRFSDVKQITRDRIQDGYIHIIQEKTGQKVVIPIHPTVEAIMNKYGGDLPRVITNQKFNEYLKEVAQKAELNTPFHKTITRGGVKQSIKYHKWELTTTHTARRSFATNLYKAGFPARSIMQITGHRTEDAFLKYIKVTPEEHARMLKDFWRMNGEHLKVV